MSRQVNTAALVSMFKIAPRAVPISELPRLYEYVSLFLPDLVAPLAQSLLTRLPQTEAEADALVRLVDAMPGDLRCSPTMLALRADMVAARDHAQITIH